MSETSVADEAEHYLKMVADPEAEPGLYECLACFVSRRVEAVGCDRTPPLDAVVPRPQVADGDRRSRIVSSRSASYCDCDLARNGYRMPRGTCSSAT